MDSIELVKIWFDKWKQGDYLNLPVTDEFTHTSPYGTVEGKEAYINLVKQNEDKFLGYSFHFHDAVYSDDAACVRYTASQGDDFELDVSEWYYFKDNLINQIVAYYHIGEIRDDRKLE